MATSAPPTSSIVACAASRGVMPCPRYALDILDHHDRVVHDDADRQHQAEQRQVVEREAEQRPCTQNVPTSETGMATIGMIAARQVCRNTMTTSTTSADRLEQRLDHLVDRLAMNSVGL